MGTTKYQHPYDSELLLATYIPITSGDSYRAKDTIIFYLATRDNDTRPAALTLSTFLQGVGWNVYLCPVKADSNATASTASLQREIFTFFARAGRPGVLLGLAFLGLGSEDRVTGLSFYLTPTSIEPIDLQKVIFNTFLETDNDAVVFFDGVMTSAPFSERQVAQKEILAAYKAGVAPSAPNHRQDFVQEIMSVLSRPARPLITVPAIGVEILANRRQMISNNGIPTPLDRCPEPVVYSNPKPAIRPIFL